MCGNGLRVNGVTPLQYVPTTKDSVREGTVAVTGRVGYRADPGKVRPRLRNDRFAPSIPNYLTLRISRFAHHSPPCVFRFDDYRKTHGLLKTKLEHCKACQHCRGWPPAVEQGLTARSCKGSNIRSQQDDFPRGRHHRHF